MTKRVSKVKTGSEAYHVLWDILSLNALKTYTGTLLKNHFRGLKM